MTMTILLVDDDPNVLSGLRRTLQDEDCHIRCASSADDAFALLRTTPIHAIVSDQVMKDVSGLEFLRQAQRLYPSMIRILLTGYATAEMVIEAINSGCAERVFLKPCDPFKITQAIHELVARRAMLAEAARLIEENLVKAAVKNEPASSCVPEVSIESAPYGWETFMRRLNKSTFDPAHR